jgi:DNA modification methylase
MEFRSELENIMTAEELNFDPTPALGKYKSVMPPESVAHPAKFNTNLVEFLILKYTKTGDVILDPMAGTGVLGVIASLHGRNAIQVELEKRFYELMEKARENVEKYPSLTSKGWIVNILGDARRLSELIKAGYDPKDFLGGRARNAVLRHYDEVDAVITSPPYSEALSEKAGGGSKKNVLGVGMTSDGKKQGQGAPIPYSTSEDNIGNLPHGSIDAVITSPPYLRSAESGAGVNRQREGDVKIGCSTVNRTVTHPDAIDNAKEYGSIDAVITSPPYEGGFEGGSRHTGGILEREKSDAETRLKIGLGVKYSDSESNIGNLKSSDEEYEALARGLMTRDGKPTYLSEMLKVYAQMFKVLKPGGLAIVVIKPFIRNKKVVDLPYHTWLLMSRVGFKLEKLYKLRLKSQSFWRILYYRKNPDVPRIAHEYVIVTRKQTQ